MHSLEAHGSMPFFFFFLLKTVYLVNSEEPESQNCCSRNHFEKDYFRRFSSEPTLPKPCAQPSEPLGAHTTEPWNGLGGKGP